MIDKITQIGVMRFCLDDMRLTEFNNSTDCSFKLFGDAEDGEVLSIEDYYCFCKQFAAAMGFAEKTIDTWFGTY